MNDDTGTYPLLRDRRFRLEARLPAGARHQAFPQVHRRRDDDADDLASLKAENAKLRADITQLRIDRDRLQGENDDLQSELGHRAGVRSRRSPSVGQIMDAFCAAAAAAGWPTLEGEPVTVQDLRGTRLAYAPGRHVAMWLCRRLARESSLPAIARRFSKDPTTIHHGCRRAPLAMERDARLAAIAAAVLAQFDPAPAQGAGPTSPDMSTEESCT